jgi:hypothetical protein
MSRRSLAFALSFALSFAGCAKKNQAPADRGFVLRELAPNAGPSLPSLLATEAAKATAQHLKPFAYVGASWCAPCNAIKDNLDQPLMRDAFRGTYVIKLDFDEWEDRLPSAGLQHASVPVFFELDGSGKPTGRVVDGGAWGNDTIENIAPVLKAFFAH